MTLRFLQTSGNGLIRSFWTELRMRCSLAAGRTAWETGIATCRPMRITLNLR